MSLLVVVGLSFVALNLRPANRESVNAQTNQTLRIYCASGVASPVASVVDGFNQEFDAHVEIVRTGGSGELAGQIKAEHESQMPRGADVCVSADEFLLADAQSKGIMRRIVPIAFQKPVIAIPVSSSLAELDLSEMIERTVFGVASDRAAIGKIVRVLAKKEGVLGRLEVRKKMDTENVMTLAQALVTESVEAAVIWDTTVWQANKNNGGDVLRIVAAADPADRTRAKVVAGVVAGSQSASLGNDFIRYLSESRTSQSCFENEGFHWIGDKHSVYAASIKAEPASDGMAE